MTPFSCVASGAPPASSTPRPSQSHTDTSPTGYTWPFKCIKIKYNLMESRISKRYSYFHVQSSMTHNGQKIKATQSDLVTKEWINQTGSIHAMGCYPALESKDILTPATTWTSPEDTVLSERSQTQKAMNVLYGSTYRKHPGTGKSTETGVFTAARGRGV